MTHSRGEAGSNGTNSEKTVPQSLDASKEYSSSKERLLTGFEARRRAFREELNKSYHDFQRQGDWSQAAVEVLKEKWRRTTEHFNIVLDVDALFEIYGIMHTILSACNNGEDNSMPTGSQASGPTVSNGPPGSNPASNSRPKFPNLDRIKDLYELLMNRITGGHTLMNLMRYIKKMRRTIFWYIVGGGVLAGCIAGTVLTAGAGAPLFVLFLAVVQWADKDIEKHKDK